MITGMVGGWQAPLDIVSHVIISWSAKHDTHKPTNHLQQHDHFENKYATEWKESYIFQGVYRIMNSFPDPFFHSWEFRNVHIYSRAPGNDVYCCTTSAVALWKAVSLQQTPVCTTFSVNVNVHIASISPGCPLIKRDSELLPLASSFGYCTADNWTNTT